MAKKFVVSGNIVNLCVGGHIIMTPQENDIDDWEFEALQTRYEATHQIDLTPPMAQVCSIAFGIERTCAFAKTNFNYTKRKNQHT